MPLIWQTRGILAVLRNWVEQICWMLPGTIAWLAQGLSETSILTLFRTFLFWGLHTSLVLSRNFSGLHLVAWRWCEVNSWAHIPRLFTRPNAKHVHWLWALSQRWKAEKNVVLISEQQLCQGQLRYVFLNSVWSINIYYTSAFPPLFFFWRDWVCHLVLRVCIVHQNELFEVFFFFTFVHANKLCIGNH